MSAFAASSSASAASSTWSFTSGTAPSSSVITLSRIDGGGSGRSSVPASSNGDRVGVRRRRRRRRHSASAGAGSGSGRLARRRRHHVGSVVRSVRSTASCFDGPLQVAQRVAHDHARRPALHQARHRHRQVDAQGVVDEGAVAARTRTRSGRRARAACRPRPATTRTRAARRRSRSRGRSAPGARARRRGTRRACPRPAASRSRTVTCFTSLVHSGYSLERGRDREAPRGDAATSICSCASSAIARASARQPRRRGAADRPRREHAVARRPHAGEPDGQHRHQHAERIPAGGADRDGEAHEEHHRGTCAAPASAPSPGGRTGWRPRRCRPGCCARAPSANA